MTDPLRPADDAPHYDPVQPAAAPRPDPAGVAPGVLPLASVIAKPASSSGRGTSLLLLLAGAIAVGGLSFAGGRLTAPAAATTSRPGTGQLPGNGQGLPGGQGFPGRGGEFGGGISLSGTVSAVSADSITVKQASGTSITIPLDSKTAYHTAAASSAAAVTVGSEVRVTPGGGTANPGASFDPAASRAPDASARPGAGGISFGPATDVTVVAP
jgi:hypothetical protein